MYPLLKSIAQMMHDTSYVLRLSLGCWERSIIVPYVAVKAFDLFIILTLIVLLQLYESTALQTLPPKLGD